MSKSDRLRELQEENNNLKHELEQANKTIAEYKRRDNPRVGDFINPKKEMVK